MADEVVEGAEVVEEVAVEEVAEVVEESTENKAFVDSMLESIEDDNIKGSKTWDTLKGKDATELAKYIMELKSFTGKKGDIPKADASEDEWNEFYTKLGRPESIEGYDFELNSDFKELIGDESLPYYEGIVGTIQEQAFKMGASSEQAEAAVDSLLSLVAEQTEATNKLLEETAEKNLNALKTEWGDGFDAMANSIDAMMKNHGMTQEQVDWAKDSGILSEPALAIPLAKIAAGFADDPEIGIAQTTTQSGVQDRITEIEYEIQGFLKTGEPIPAHLHEQRNTLYAKLK
jgi:hypothetical protein